MKEDLIKFLNTQIPNLDVEKLLEKPKFEGHGDWSLPMFLLAKELKKAPPMIAKEFEEKLSKKLPKEISKIVAVGPFLNFYLNSQLEARQIFESFENSSILSYKTPKKEKIVLEYPSPNTNKALHLGHVRNLLLGNSLSKIFKSAGNKIIKANLNNDRGISVCQAMVAYEEFGEGKTPKSEKIKADKFIANYYVLFGKKKKEMPELETKAQEMLLKWESGDKKVIALWEKMLSWVYEGYKQTYIDYKYKSDKDYFESQIYKEGKEIVLNALKNKAKGFGKEKDGAIFCDLSDVKLDKKYLLRKDGTTLYMTQDIYLATQKEKDFNADKYIYLTANEQDYHFKVLFEILERLGFANKEKLYHLSYGYVTLPEGKMKSREGNVVEADELLSEVISDAFENLKKKSPELDKKEAKRRAEIIGYGALAFFILKYNPTSDFVFNPKESLSFEGETGPYVQYTYARIKSVLRKANWKRNCDIDYSVFGEKEIALIKILKEFPEVLEEATLKYKISLIANYLIKICQGFNEFYQNCPINTSEEKVKKARLLLAENVSLIIAKGLELLDIEVLEEM
ncbi:MAG: arginine--tRNA ligase [Nanoarchaeota archaeon]